MRTDNVCITRRELRLLWEATTVRINPSMQQRIRQRLAELGQEELQVVLDPLMPHLVVECTNEFRLKREERARKTVGIPFREESHACDARGPYSTFQVHRHGRSYVPFWVKG